MAQIGFFLGEAGLGPFGIPAGVANLIVAWDPFNGGPGVGLGMVFQKVMAASVLGGGRIRSFGPIAVPAWKAGPNLLTAGTVLKFKLEGGTGVSGVADLTFNVFKDSKKIYSASAGTGEDTIKVSLKGFTTASLFSFVGELNRTDDQTVFDALMTNDGPLF